MWTLEPKNINLESLETLKRKKWVEIFYFNKFFTQADIFWLEGESWKNSWFAGIFYSDHRGEGIQKVNFLFGGAEWREEFQQKLSGGNILQQIKLWVDNKTQTWPEMHLEKFFTLKLSIFMKCSGRDNSWRLKSYHRGWQGSQLEWRKERYLFQSTHMCVCSLSHTQTHICAHTQCWWCLTEHFVCYHTLS